MITSRVPADWRALQADVAQVLRECGFIAEIEKKIETVRGSVTVDVYAEETVRGRPNLILCECKLWRSRVPQAVVHGFRNVVTDSGANIGYIVSTAGFQAGAFAAADRSNVRLVTWEGFQAEFEQSWIDHFFLPEITERLDALFSHTEPLIPRVFDDLSDEDQAAYLQLRDRYEAFGWLMTMFTTRAVEWRPMPQLPIRHRAPEQMVPQLDHMPAEVVDAATYREFLEAALRHGQAAIAAFRAVLRRSGAQ
jgi:hypothetical protein